MSNLHDALSKPDHVEPIANHLSTQDNAGSSDSAMVEKGNEPLSSQLKKMQQAAEHFPCLLFDPSRIVPGDIIAYTPPANGILSKLHTVLPAYIPAIVTRVADDQGTVNVRLFLDGQPESFGVHGCEWQNKVTYDPNGQIGNSWRLISQAIINKQTPPVPEGADRGG